MNRFLRRLGLGRVAYRLYHQPAAAIATSVREGGPLEQLRTARGRRAMAAAAGGLPAPTPGPGAPVSLHLLTGARFWYQSAFCLWTFARQSGRPVAPVIYDDGSLAPDQRDLLLRLFPAGRCVPRAEVSARLDRLLPAARFPYLRDRWLHYPNIRKLTDPHLGGSGWKLVIDSDLLFFRRPAFLLDWLDHPDRPLHAVDVESCYGYPTARLSELTRAPVAERVNVGLTGLRSEEIDWEKLEAWCRALIEESGTHYYLEQALVAALVAGRDCAVAPAADYVTLPRPPEAESCSAAMHHYVADSKSWYFRRNWRRAMT